MACDTGNPIFCTSFAFWVFSRYIRHCSLDWNCEKEKSKVFPLVGHGCYHFSHISHSNYEAWLDSSKYNDRRLMLHGQFDDKRIKEAVTI